MIGDMGSKIEMSLGRVRCPVVSSRAGLLSPHFALPQSELRISPKWHFALHRSGSSHFLERVALRTGIRTKLILEVPRVKWP